MHIFLTMKKWFSIWYILFLVFIQGQAQNTKLNFWITRAIDQAPDSMALSHLMAVGNSDRIKKYVEVNQGVWKYAFQDVCSFAVPVWKIKELSQQYFVDRIAFSSLPGTLLNDKVRAHVFLDSVQNGSFPLYDSLLGDGVVVGVVDESLDWMHPDFLTEDGHSRILHYWNQNASGGNVPMPYNYGSEWNKLQIEAGQVTQPNQNDHGSHVTGIACGNGLANGKNRGIAPKADIVFVDYYQGNAMDFTQTVADAVHYIFAKADQLGKPCVINLSLGTYQGSHDGQDPAAQLIDQMLLSQPGRAVVCAAGNSGDIDAYHLSYEVNLDTAFTWFTYNSIIPGVFFELYADTQNFNQVFFSIGVDRVQPFYQKIAQTTYVGIALGNTTQNIVDFSGNYIGQWHTYTELQGGKYFLQCWIDDIDSMQYLFRFSTTGHGRFDIWSNPSLTGTSLMLSTENYLFPGANVFPDVLKYKYPDKNASIVSSWACSPQVITVGNYVNTDHFTDFNGNVQSFNYDPGELNSSSSKGPTRDLRIKPDITAPGTIVMSCAKLINLAQDTINFPHVIAQGGYHKRNSGTSMASPVICGLAALYFQKCPGRTAADFKSDLLSTSFQDNYTGATPSNSWGQGKPNAFSLLNVRNQAMNLSVSDTSACSFVHAQVQPDTMAVLWNDIDTHHQRLITQEGYYYAHTWKDNCYSRTQGLYIDLDTVNLAQTSISSLDLPPFCQESVIHMQIDSLFDAYVWTHGVEQAQAQIESSGTYIGYGLDSSGCFVASDTVSLLFLPSPPKPQLQQVSNYLVSTIAYQYQWYYNGQVLLDSTSKLIYPTYSGWYYVEAIHINGCSSFSDSIYFVALLDEKYFSNNLNISLYPNPSHQQIRVRGILLNDQLFLMDALGRVCGHWTPSSEKDSLDVSDIPEGIYHLMIERNKQIISALKCMIIHP